MLPLKLAFFQAATAAAMLHAADFQFSPAQVDEIDTRLTSARRDKNYTPVYDYVLQCTTDDLGTSSERPKADVDKSVWQWMQGAKKVNGNSNDYFSQFIRDFTKEQY